MALPPLGAGNGGLEWAEVREMIVGALADPQRVDILVYEPTSKYHNVTKRRGTERLTPARALIAELVRRYWVLGMECSLLEVQKLARNSGANRKLLRQILPHPVTGKS